MSGACTPILHKAITLCNQSYQSNVRDKHQLQIQKNKTSSLRLEKLGKPYRHTAFLQGSQLHLECWAWIGNSLQLGEKLSGRVGGQKTTSLATTQTSASHSPSPSFLLCPSFCMPMFDDSLSQEAIWAKLALACCAVPLTAATSKAARRNSEFRFLVYHTDVTAVYVGSEFQSSVHQRQNPVENR